MNLLITASRQLENNEENYTRLRQAVAEAHVRYNGLQADDCYHYPTEVLHGGAKGGDELAARLAHEEQLTETILRPDYQRHYKKIAPLKRNTELVKRADLVLALYAPKRTREGGTWDTVKKAIAAGLPVLEVMPDGVLRWTVATPRLL